MYAQIDDIIFEQLNSFQSFSDQEAAIWATHQLMTGKPSLQPTANDNRTASISIRLHQRFINVADAWAALQTKIRNHTVCPLIWGNGNVEGDFVITSLDRSIEQQDNEGHIYSIQVNISLTEYQQADPLQTKKNNARASALAIGDPEVTIPVVVNDPSLLRQYYNTLIQQAALVRSYIAQGTSGIQNNPVREALGIIADTLNLVQNAKGVLGLADLQLAIVSTKTQAQQVTAGILSINPITDLLDVVDEITASINGLLVDSTAITAVNPVAGKAQVVQLMGNSKRFTMYLKTLSASQNIADPFNANAANAVRQVLTYLNSLSAITSAGGEAIDNYASFDSLVQQAISDAQALSDVLPVVTYADFATPFAELLASVIAVMTAGSLLTYQTVTRTPNLKQGENTDFYSGDYSGDDYSI